MCHIYISLISCSTFRFLPFFAVLSDVKLYSTKFSRFKSLFFSVNGTELHCFVLCFVLCASVYVAFITLCLHVSVNSVIGHWALN